MSAADLLAEALRGSPAAASIGWTIVHFLWQGALLGGLLWLVLAALGRSGPGVRYGVCCAGMLLLLATPLVTFAFVQAASPRPSMERTLALLAVAPPDTTVRAMLSQLVPWLSIPWILGVAMLQARLLGQWLAVRRLSRIGCRPAPSHWQQELTRLAQRCRVRRAVQLVESVRVDVPTVVGWLAPIVLVPVGLWNALPPEQLRAILVHELAHVRRHDYLVNLLQALFESLLFFHPVTWWLSHRLRIEREYCCDDVAVRVSGDALGYARALSTLDAWRSTGARPALASGAACPAAAPSSPALTSNATLSSAGGSLMDRITRLLGVTTPGTHAGGRWLASALLLLSMTTALSAVHALAPTHDGDDEAACALLHERCETISEACEREGCTEELAAECEQILLACEQLAASCEGATDCDLLGECASRGVASCDALPECVATDALIVRAEAGDEHGNLFFGDAGFSGTLSTEDERHDPHHNVLFTLPHPGHDGLHGDGDHDVHGDHQADANVFTLHGDHQGDANVFTLRGDHQGEANVFTLRSDHQGDADTQALHGNHQADVAFGSDTTNLHSHLQRLHEVLVGHLHGGGDDGDSHGGHGLHSEHEAHDDDQAGHSVSLLHSDGMGEPGQTIRITRSQLESLVDRLREALGGAHDVEIHAPHGEAHAAGSARGVNHERRLY